MTISNGRWIVVETKPCEEFFASADLERKGFDVFLPWVDRDIRTGPAASKRARIERRAYFTRYVFVFLSHGKSLFKVRKCMGVTGVLCNGEVPVTADAEVTQLKAFATPNGYIDIPKRATTWRHGVKKGQVRPIISGPFLGHSGVVEAVDKRGVVDILVSVFGRSTLISVPVAGLGEQQIHPNGGAMSALPPTG